MNSVQQEDVNVTKHVERLAVSEIFGPVIQGEGPSAGHPAVFLRLSGCNLKCGFGGNGWICDTPYTWNFGKPHEAGGWKGGVPTFDPSEEIQPLTSYEVVDEILAHRKLANLLVVSGGEPMLQQTNLLTVVSRLRYQGLTSEVETNGTIVPNSRWTGSRFNVSPKFENSGQWNVDHSERRVNATALAWHNKNSGSVFKFVMSEPKDIEAVRKYIRGHDLNNQKVWIMPEGTSSAEINARMSWIFEAAASNGWRVSTRLHVLAFGNQRGV